MYISISGYVSVSGSVGNRSVEFVDPENTGFRRWNFSNNPFHCIVITTSGFWMYISISGYVSASDSVVDRFIEFGDPENMGFDVGISQITQSIA